MALNIPHIFDNDSLMQDFSFFSCIFPTPHFINSFPGDGGGGSLV